MELYEECERKLEHEEQEINAAADKKVTLRTSHI